MELRVALLLGDCRANCIRMGTGQRNQDVPVGEPPLQDGRASFPVFAVEQADAMRFGPIP